ncbi:MAG: PqqD family peptide modification chaperone [Sedimenticola sp.]
MSEAIELPQTCHLFFIDGQGLLFRESTQQLFGLNTLATFFWCCLEENPSTDEVVKRVTETFSLTVEKARSLLNKSIEDWRSIGVLDGGDPPASDVMPEPTYLTTQDGVPPFVERNWSQVRHYYLLDHRVSVAMESDAFDAPITAVIGHLELSESAEPISPSGDALGEIHIATDGDAITIYRNRVAVAHFSDASAIAPTVKSTLLQEAIDNHDYLFYFHSGVLSNGQELVMLPGEAGAGKSTLTAGLANAGMTYYTDEVALLSTESHSLRPFPIALCSKSTAWPVASTLFPGFDQLPSFIRLDGKCVRYTPPQVDPFDPDYDRPLPVRHLVFPKYSPDTSTRLTPVDRVSALQRLMVECLAIKRPLVKDDVEWLVEWIKGIECYELPNNSLDEAVKSVVDLVG